MRIWKERVFAKQPASVPSSWSLGVAFEFDAMFVGVSVIGERGRPALGDVVPDIRPAGTGRV